MWQRAFSDLLSHPDPGFICYSAGDPLQKEGYCARVWNRANIGAPREAVQKIASIPGGSYFADFYSNYNGARLFVLPNTVPGGSLHGLELFPLEEWPKRTEQMIEDWNDIDESRMPYKRDEFLAIGHPCGASNYIHWVVKGPTAGRIYWWSWTTGPEELDPPLAFNFGEFLQLIGNEPVRLLNNLLGGYTTFRDGKTRNNWMPKRYVADCSVAAF